MADPIKIVGAGVNRRKNDFYPTPSECTQALLDFLQQRFLIRPKDSMKQGDIIWEPACGDGAMANVMRKNGYGVIETDITQGFDYLKTDLTYGVSWIITNPPFSLSEEFIERSASFDKPFALLLKSQYWHSSKRLDLFNDHRPTFVLPLTWRPDFTGQGNSLLDMMWVVWLGKAPVTYYQPLKKPKGERHG